MLAILAAFGAGMLVMTLGDRSDVPEAARKPLADSDRREVFSPDFRSDPHFLAEQRRNVETLEQYCESSGKLCAEARAARDTYEKLRDDS